MKKKIKITPVSEWANLAATAKRSGVESVSAYLVMLALHGIAPGADAIRRGWEAA